MTHALRSASEYAWRHPWIPIALFALGYGIRFADVDEFRAITANPYVVNVQPQYQFLYASPLTFFLGSYYQHHAIDPGTSFLIVAALGLVLLAAAAQRWVAAEFDRPDRPVAWLVLCSSPLLFVVLFWVGKSDVYLLAFFLLLAASASPVTRAILAALVVLCHGELGAAVLVGYALLTPLDWRSVVAGLGVGESALFIYTHRLLSAVPLSRSAYAFSHLSDLASVFWAHPILHLVAALGPFWLYVAARRQIAIAETLVLAAAFALSVLSYDYTRVFVIVSLPLILVVTKDAAMAMRRDSGLGIGSYVLGAHALWPLVFLQVQLAGPKLFWARGEILLK